MPDPGQAISEARFTCSQPGPDIAPCNTTCDADMKQVFRVLALLFLLPLVAGFGLCGVLGVMAGFMEGELVSLVFGLIGIPIAIGLGAVCRAILREMRKD